MFSSLSHFLLPNPPAFRAAKEKKRDTKDTLRNVPYTHDCRTHMIAVEDTALKHLSFVNLSLCAVLCRITQPVFVTSPPSQNDHM